MKFGTKDALAIAERSSARETAARVAAGAIAKLWLREFNIHTFGYVVSIGISPFPRPLSHSPPLMGGVRGGWRKSGETSSLTQLRKLR
ncbi:unnamed protein product, partial [marine sediment metagenome]